MSGELQTPSPESPKNQDAGWEMFEEIQEIKADFCSAATFENCSVHWVIADHNNSYSFHHVGEEIMCEFLFLADFL